MIVGTTLNQVHRYFEMSSQNSEVLNLWELFQACMVKSTDLCVIITRTTTDPGTQTALQVRPSRSARES